MKTATDTRKENADFTLEQIDGDAVIKIKNSDVFKSIRKIKETYENGNIRISRITLDKIQKLFTWEPDF